jgi:hypothetical protein
MSDWLQELPVPWIAVVAAATATLVASSTLVVAVWATPHLRGVTS